MSNLNQHQNFTKQNKAVIYVRVASQIQGSNKALEHQKNLCTKYALQNSLETSTCFTNLGKMFDYIKQNSIKNVIAYHLDRFSRFPTKLLNILELLENENVKVHTVVKPNKKIIALDEFHKYLVNKT